MTETNDVKEMVEGLKLNMEQSKDVKELIINIDKVLGSDLRKILVGTQSVVYGGMIRDCVSGDKINDIDVVVPEKYRDLFDSSMKSLEYKGEENSTNETMIWKKEGCLDVEAYCVEHDPDELQITPVSAPDFNVNTLAYDCASGKIIAWNLSCGYNEEQKQIEKIMESIKKKIAVIDELELKMFEKRDEAYKKDREIFAFVVEKPEIREFPPQNRIDKIKKRGYTIVKPC